MMFPDLFLWLYSGGVTVLVLLLGWRLFPAASLAKKEQSIDESLLNRLLPLLIQYKTVMRAILSQPDLPAQNILPLLKVLDGVADYWQLQPIGAPWERVAFDPQLHQPDSPDIQRGEAVYVRFVGYRLEERILAPAKVSRQLPPSPS